MSEVPDAVHQITIPFRTRRRTIYRTESDGRSKLPSSLTQRENAMTLKSLDTSCVKLIKKTAVIGVSLLLIVNLLGLTRGRAWRDL